MKVKYLFRLGPRQFSAKITPLLKVKGRPGRGTLVFSKVIKFPSQCQRLLRSKLTSFSVVIENLLKVKYYSGQGSRAFSVAKTGVRVHNCGHRDPSS